MQGGFAKQTEECMHTCFCYSLRYESLLHKYKNTHSGVYHVLEKQDHQGYTKLLNDGLS